eukprot:CAMPEP_0182444284 /NCGR_PEP_ID=MMETSP1172-20130603/2788_1 /TAXON_ID=708627 /ORGANISM="Timspurckia oligopyrenoides, Strain CCMP3278" /LENGTH=56 /DNA_ID=CAMNT_0024639807 /DNA_START=663 /DNA_END=833 /DNA_ORIENTATION=-
MRKIKLKRSWSAGRSEGSSESDGNRKVEDDDDDDGDNDALDAECDVMMRHLMAKNA